MIIKGIIVDDEELGRTNLHTLINVYCPNIKIIALAEDILQAKEIIDAEKPDVVFLDINMPGGNGFDLVNSFEIDDLPIIIFVTAYDKYAIQAIKTGAFDYILKPIDVSELELCEQKLLSKLDKKQDTANEIEANDEKISIKHNKGVKLIRTRNILYIEAEGSYSIIHITTEVGEEKFVASRALRDFENILSGKHFYRVHKSFLVNVMHVEEFSVADSQVIMKNNIPIEVSRRKGISFKQFLDDHYNRFKQ